MKLTLVCRNLVETKVYQKVMNHRNHCIHWRDGTLCLECFGGGLTRFVRNLLDELKTTSDADELRLKQDIEFKILELEREIDQFIASSDGLQSLFKEEIHDRRVMIKALQWTLKCREQL